VLAAQLKVRAAFTATPRVDMNVASAVTLICFAPSEAVSCGSALSVNNVVAQER
jgi:hypothetical protein